MPTACSTPNSCFLVTMLVIIVFAMFIKLINATITQIRYTGSFVTRVESFAIASWS